MRKLDYAQLFTSLGIAVIPLKHRSKEPESVLMGGTWEQYRHELPTVSKVNQWLGSDWQNYGVVAGWENLVIIDIDDPETLIVWMDYYKTYVEKYNVLDGVPFMVRTSRGAHIYVKSPNAGKANRKLRGIDVKYNGYVVGPMSIHPSGVTYLPQNTEYQFPWCWNLDTLLPEELFPATTADQAEMFLPTPLELKAVVRTDYDPFISASGTQQGVDLLQKVKSSVRVENFFPDAQKTSIDGRWWAARCPFHDDKSPSFWIDVRRQICGCQVCGMKPMDVINLYARMHGLDNTAAIIALANEVKV